VVPGARSQGAYCLAEALNGVPHRLRAAQA
jgi:hypothetical protein